MSLHSHGEGASERQVLRGLWLAVELSLGILLIESLGAVLSHSLSLTVDAVHNVPDILAFLLSWSAIRDSEAGATPRFTFGAHRMETFAGLFNALLVLATGAAFGYGALVYLLRGGTFDGTVDPVWVLAAAVPTLALRGAGLLVLQGIPGRVRELNLRSVILHLGSDLVITLALLIAGLVLLLRPSIAWVDPVAALAIAAVLVYEALPLLRDGWDVLTERIPRNLSVEAITASALGVPGVRALHDVHVWSVCSSLVCLTAHVGVGEVSLREATNVVAELRLRMEQEFGIVHSTFEVEGPAPA